MLILGAFIQADLMVVRVDTQITNFFVVFFMNSDFIDSGVDLSIFSFSAHGNLLFFLCRLWFLENGLGYYVAR